MPSCTTCKFCRGLGKLNVSCNGLSIPSQEPQTEYSIDISIGSIFNATMLYDLANPYDTFNGSYRTIFLSPNFYTFCTSFEHWIYGLVEGMKSFTPFGGGEYVEYTDVAGDVSGCVDMGGIINAPTAFSPVNTLTFADGAKAMMVDIQFFPDPEYSVISTLVNKTCDSYNTRYFVLSINLTIMGTDPFGSLITANWTAGFVNGIGIHEAFNTLDLYKLVRQKQGNEPGNPFSFGPGTPSASQTTLLGIPIPATMTVTAL